MLKQKVQDWQIDELGGIFISQNKTGRKAGEGLEQGKYKFFTSSSKQTKFINEYDFEGEHLIFSTGGQAGIHYCKERFSASNDCFVVKVDNKILTKYIYYYFSTKIYLLEEGFLGAGLKHISKDYIKKIRIKYPQNKEAQQKIVSILEKAENLKERRRKINEETNKIIQSIFYERFGDFNSNKKNWERLTLPLIVKKDKNSIKRGPFGGSLKKDIFVSEGYLVYEQRHAIHNDFEYAKYYITKEKYDEMKIFKVIPEDLIISCSGVTLGRIAEIPKNAKPGIINQALLKISLDPKKVNNEYFKFLFRGKAVQEILFGFSRGSGIPNFPSISEVKKVKFLIPPIDIQNKFAYQVKKIEQIKKHQQKSEQEINTLFDALMQKAFNGELIRWI